MAWLIDVVIIGVVTGILGRLFSVASVDTTAANMAGSVQYSNPFMLLAPIYLVVMDVKYGATVGKMALGLRVQDEATGKNLTVVQAILREVVGKFVSSIALCLGYFWIIWDPKKQGWHDKIAKSLVVKTK